MHQLQVSRPWQLGWLHVGRVGWVILSSRASGGLSQLRNSLWDKWAPRMEGVGFTVCLFLAWVSQRSCPLSPCSAWSTCTTFTLKVATQGQKVSKATSQAAAQETWAQVPAQSSGLVSTADDGGWQPPVGGAGRAPPTQGGYPQK